MNWEEFIKDYLTFTRKERIGILVIVALILIIFFLLPKITNRQTTAALSTTDTTWIKSVRSMEVKPDKKEFSSSSVDEEFYDYQYDRNKGYNVKGELFYFDPNTLPPSGWKKLGLKEKTIQTIQNYLSKGGNFKKPEDLKKVYGLFKDQYERLAPFIKIEDPGYAKTVQGNQLTSSSNDNTRAKNANSHFSIIDINTADTTAFISLPGIGSKLAARIVNFREKLGGFYSIEQVGETYGVPDSTFQKIKHYLNLENTSIRKININTATVDELKAHPYISWSLANPIVAYRNEHGPFQKMEDLKKVMIITDEIYIKISPYFIIQY